MIELNQLNCVLRTRLLILFCNRHELLFTLFTSQTCVHTQWSILYVYCFTLHPNYFGLPRFICLKRSGYGQLGLSKTPRAYFGLNEPILLDLEYLQFKYSNVCKLFNTTLILPLVLYCFVLTYHSSDITFCILQIVTPFDHILFNDPVVYLIMSMTKLIFRTIIVNLVIRKTGLLQPIYVDKLT